MHRSSVVCTGRIKSLNRDRGFGFLYIDPDSGCQLESVFFHRSNVDGCLFEELKVGQKMTFRIVANQRDSGKVQAVECKLRPAAAA